MENYNQLQSIANSIKLVGCLYFIIVLTSCAPSTDTTTSTETPTNNSATLASLIKTSNPNIEGLNVNVDDSDSANPKLTIAGLTNSVSGNGATATISIDQSQGITTVPTSITVTAPTNVSPHEDETTLMVTFGSEPAVTYAVTTRIAGAPVSSWMTSQSINTYIKATFLDQTATIALDGNELSVRGLANRPLGGDESGGMIVFGPPSETFRGLPSGFTSTANFIVFTNPQGIGVAESAPTPRSFTITETENSENSQEYTINNISLAGLENFDPMSHIAVTKVGENTPEIGLTITTDTATSPNKITVTGLTNEAGANTYTLTINEMPGFTIDNAPFTRTIAEPREDFSPGAGAITDGGTFAPTFQITNVVENTATMYELEVVFSGAPVSDWFTGDLTRYITASFAGQTADALTLSTGTTPTIAISHNDDSSNNFTNAPTGILVLTTNNFPTGYALDTNALNSSAIGGLAAVNAGPVGMIAISETTAGVNNSNDYPVTITLSAYKSPIDLSAITYAATADLDSSKAGARLETNASGANEIIISGFTNTAGTTGSGTVTFQTPTGYTLSASSFTFNNPSGASATNTNIGTVTVTNTFTGADGMSKNIEVPHQVTVQFSGVVQLKVAGGDAGSSDQTIGPGGEIAISTAACELLTVPTTITVLDSTGTDISGSGIAALTPFPRYYDRDRDTLDSGKYTVIRRLVLEYGNGILDSGFTIMMKFPACASFPSGQTGADEANAYQIDSAPKLDLVSYLISNEAINYRNKYYKITVDIDMGLPGLPFSEMGSKISSGDGSPGKGFIPIGKIGAEQFSGTFDCDNKIISNLYINRLGAGEVGLLGSIVGSTTVKNCSLIDVKITGDNNVGGLVGNGGGSSILGSHVTGNVTGITSNVGGLVGSANSSTITDSYATATVSGDRRIGGLVGLLGSSTINNSYATGAVIGTGDDVGGLIGRVFKVSSISSVTNSYATGAVTGSSSVGGLVGSGTNPLTFSDSYATGAVTGSSAVGGLVGSNGGAITRSYAIGAVTGSSAVGGLVGTGAANSSVTASYWNTEVSGSPSTSPGGGTGRTTAQMQVDAPVPTGANVVYEGWETTTWRFATGQYPRLINVACANQQNPGGGQGTAPCSSPLQ
ncbi:hypothetical protein COTS27_01087 [Spirochaetota bacterium]|nr:hypothetical protein COTS27_01087 [Spirochaetota bacterium]